MTERAVTNPFNTQQIKNYLLLYAAVLVIMILFYFLNASLNSVEVKEKRVFETNTSSVRTESMRDLKGSEDENSSIKRIRLLDKAF